MPKKSKKSAKQTKAPAKTKEVEKEIEQDFDLETDEVEQDVEPDQETEESFDDSFDESFYDEEEPEEEPEELKFQKGFTPMIFTQDMFYQDPEVPLYDKGRVHQVPNNMVERWLKRGGQIKSLEEGPKSGETQDEDLF